MTICILGTEYTVTEKDYNEDRAFFRDKLAGYCNFRIAKIVVCDMATHPDFKEDSAECRLKLKQETLRHEILHAFLSESGLDGSAFCSPDIPWSKNEEMIDWIALQGPKIYKAWEEAGAV